MAPASRGTSRQLACTVCASASYFAYPHPEADIYRCGTCGHCFSDANSIREHEGYGEQYHADAHRNWMENPNLKLFGWLESEIRRAGDRCSVLDIGCGRAQFLQHLARRNPGFRLTGIELDPFPAPQGVRMLTGDFLQMEFGEQFDCVVSQAVIEHVADVGQFVDRAIELCRPGGRLMLMTLNEQSVLYSVARLLRRLGWHGPFDQLYSKHHLNHFSKNSLRRLLTDRGIRMERRYDHHIPLKAVDFPQQNPMIDGVRKLGVQACFGLGELTRRCYLQTVVGQKPGLA